MIKKLILFLLVVAFSFANMKVVSIDGQDYNENEFYEFYPKSEWERITQSQKERIFNDFIRKKTAVVAAKEENFLDNPRNAIKMRNRSDFLYVNKTYEKLVALPLVPQDYIELGKKYILKDLNISHILIGFMGSEMTGNFTLSEQEAYEEASSILSSITDSTDFGVLALEKSDDPGVNNNKGSLGWITWGKVDPEFQKQVFQLKKGEISDPILTKYGYHIVYIEDERESETINFPEDKLIEKIEFTSITVVKDKLKEAADKHDTDLLDEINFKFNENVVAELGQILSDHQKKMSYMNNVDIVPVLNEYTKDDIVITFNGKGYGVKWLVNKISKSSPSRRPSITNTESLKLTIQTLVLQLFAVEKGKQHNLNETYGFRSQYNGIESEVLYDAYVRHLVNNAPDPSEEEILDYYGQYKETKYKEPERYSVYNLKVKSKDLADSLHTSIKNGSDFFELAKTFSIMSPKKSGKMHPFDKSKNKDIISALDGVEPGKLSEVFNTRDKKWSIVHFENILPEEILPFDRVKNRIKTALKKENQNSHKEHTFEALKEKYDVTINQDFFQFEGKNK